MRNFQVAVEIRKPSIISAFSICMTVPLRFVEFDGVAITLFKDEFIKQYSLDKSVRS